MRQNRFFFLITLLLAGGLWTYGTYFAPPRPPHKRPPGTTSPGNRRVEKTDADWKAILTRSEYNVTRKSGTEWPNSSDLTHETHAGVYHCVCCKNPLFSSGTKFDSHTGWPSFYAPVVANAVYNEPDGNRTEVRCSVCDAHLGHVFTDGPAPTGLRYCMNGVALAFSAQAK
ncbi:peptide-methionine (R)-S-oxide reductase MsrB [Spirosoma fluviale]|uniref:peptide-methionine (R)-S-oxide reductase n=1 Tax=Spirosoma fluviale TaxID=1597977 RepID=A0A286F8L2_9BACT|nr:peptide-methionine (R)-S-oxide reductase MsrB [Spirosoma fluviale]SOD79567.1 peptide-methionine (R)-S-oxide reductase [Spirosoma fluviale]